MDKTYVKVLIPRPGTSLFVYSVPEYLNLKPGDVVEVELRKLKIWGVVESFLESLPKEIKERSIKPVLGKIISSPLFSNKAQTDFLKWVSDYYIYPFQKIVKQVFSPLVNSKNELYGNSDPMKHSGSVLQSDNVQPVTLNKDQDKAFNSIVSRWENKDFSPTLLYGVTGSGKSEVFAELSRRIIRSGKQVLYLVPEIGLTSRTAAHLIKRVGHSGVVLHSYMSRKKRFSSLFAAMNRQAGLIIGTRSSILYPFIDPGLIIIDEEHDQSYKNFESPYYNARDAAIMKSSLLKIPVVLGSATPSSDSWYNAVNGKYNMEVLNARANNRPLPKIRQFSFKGELHIPSELVSFIRSSLEKKEQTLFFLNRRGFATFSFCSECKEPVTCPNCFTAMVYHKKKNRMVCHHCSYNMSSGICNKCGKSGLKFEGVGVERLKEALEQYFPGSNITSFDKDSLGTISSYEKALQVILEGKSDIIIGTVMVSKGHNFPMLKNVVIKYADHLLSFRDTRAAEKCFQVITQVAGRAGRFEGDGSVNAEALSPEHYIWKYIPDHNYTGFMKEELLWRKKLMLPPYTRMTIIKISGNLEDKVKKHAEALYGEMEYKIGKNNFKNIVLYPPEEPPLSRIRSKFRMNITVISSKNGKGVKELYSLLTSASKPSGVNINFDIDAINET